jgi:hypothetical protein
VTDIQVAFGTGGPWEAALDTAAITAHDPSFSLEAFVSFAEAVFLRVNQARATGHLDGVRRMLTDTVVEELEAEGRTHRTGVALDRAAAVDAGREGAWDTVTVRFAAHASTGDRTLPFGEDWTFQRPASASAATAAADCPVCGAPRLLTAEGACRYCGSPIAGGTGGWLLVRYEAVDALALAAVLEPALAPPKTSSSWPVRRGCLATSIALLVVAGSIAFGATHDNGGGSSTPQVSFSGQANLTGAITSGMDGDVRVLGASTGNCAAMVRDAVGLSFTHTETSDRGDKTLTAVVNLPPGVRGPGTYDLSQTPMKLTVDYQSQTTSGSGAAARSQVWDVRSGQTGAVLVLKPDGSGTLTVAGLAPEDTQPPGDSLGNPLNIALSVSCG